VTGGVTVRREWERRGCGFKDGGRAGSEGRRSGGQLGRRGPGGVISRRVVGIGRLEVRLGIARLLPRISWGIARGVTRVTRRGSGGVVGGRGGRVGRRVVGRARVEWRLGLREKVVVSRTRGRERWRAVGCGIYV
jgi:hypothetical protein